MLPFAELDKRLQRKTFKFDLKSPAQLKLRLILRHISGIDAKQ
jgi:hypothetical protein